MLSKPLLLTMLVLGGCASAAHPPSLAVRPIELTADAAPAARLLPALRPIDGQLSAHLDALLSDARNADAAFARAEGEGAAAIRAGSGAKAGSERWIAAEQARSSLVAARQRTSEALSTLDALVIAQAQAQAADPASGGLAELQSAQATVDAMLTRQTARIETLTR